MQFKSRAFVRGSKGVTVGSNSTNIRIVLLRHFKYFTNDDDDDYYYYYY